MVSYEPLRILMIKAKINSTNLRNDLSIGTNTISKINNDSGYVSLEVLEKVAGYISEILGRSIAADEVITFMPDLNE